jgi:hypothetical protein
MLDRILTICHAEDTQERCTASQRPNLRYDDGAFMESDLSDTYLGFEPNARGESRRLDRTKNVTGSRFTDAPCLFDSSHVNSVHQCLLFDQCTSDDPFRKSDDASPALNRSCLVARGIEQ